MADSGIQLDFVVLGACHSETAAKIFLLAGADHVIAIPHDEKILDTAVLTFTQIFYQEVWKSRSKICKCFNIARENVRSKHGDSEAGKFLLFLGK